MRGYIAGGSSAAAGVLVAAGVLWGASSIAIAQERPSGSSPPAHSPGSAGELDDPIPPAAADLVGAGLGSPGSATINLYGSDFRQSWSPRAGDAADKSGGAAPAVGSRTFPPEFPGLTSPLSGLGIGHAGLGLPGDSHFAVASPFALHWNDPIRAHRQSLGAMFGPTIGIPMSSRGDATKSPLGVGGADPLHRDGIGVRSGVIGGGWPLPGGSTPFGAGAPASALLAPPLSASTAFPLQNAAPNHSPWKSGDGTPSLRGQNPLGFTSGSGMSREGRGSIWSFRPVESISAPRPLRPLNLSPGTSAPRDLLRKAGALD